MTKFDDFVRPLPDIYLRRTSTDEDSEPISSDDITQEYILETLEPGIMTWILRKRIQAHQELTEDFEDKFERSYPTLLFVCGNASTERRAQRIVENSYLGFETWTTTRERLASQETAIWRDEWDEDEIVLRDL